MNCLHLCNDYLGSQVHTNLYRHLEKLEINQTVFVPLRKEREEKYKEGRFFMSNRTRIVFSPCLKRHHKVLFKSKINYLYKSLESQLDLAQFDVVCASTLYSDGLLAYMLYEKYQIPYFVAVRSVDIDVFMRYRPDLNGLLLKILKHAQQVIFISEGLKTKFFKRLKTSNVDVKAKSIVIHNGIDDFWLENRSMPAFREAIRFLYVGSLIKRKNIGRVMRAIINVRNAQGIPLHLGVVGDGGYYSKRVRDMAAKYPECISYYGQIADKKNLQTVYQQHDIFIMPSYRETFGLVYVEALSQGLSLIISEGEGVDGLFDDVAVKVNPFSIKSIEDAILYGHKNHDVNKVHNTDLYQFTWEGIAEVYYKLLNKYEYEK